MAVVITHSTPADASFSTEGATAWNANHTLSGVGTLAEQDANAVAITGGAIDGTAIGGTTPAAAVFTTLTATGQTSLGGAAAVESLRVSASGGSAGSNNYVDVSGTLGSGNPLIASGGTGANAGLAFRIKGTGAYTFGTGGSSANIQFQVVNTASAVNFVQVTGSANGYTAGTGATILFTGSDTTVSGTIAVNGTGSGSTISFSGGGVSNNHAFRVQTQNAVNTGNLIQVQGAVAGSAPSVQAISGPSGTDANIDLTLTPKGTGNVRFGTFTSSILTPTGYVEIKDSGGTVRRLLVG